MLGVRGESGNEKRMINNQNKEKYEKRNENQNKG
jgi:hypothetical protein